MARSVRNGQAATWSKTSQSSLCRALSVRSYSLYPEIPPLPCCRSEAALNTPQAPAASLQPTRWNRQLGLSRAAGREERATLPTFPDEPDTAKAACLPTHAMLCRDDPACRHFEAPRTSAWLTSSAAHRCDSSKCGGRCCWVASTSRIPRSTESRRGPSAVCGTTGWMANLEQTPGARLAERMENSA